MRNLALGLFIGTLLSGCTFGGPPVVEAPTGAAPPSTASPSAATDGATNIQAATPPSTSPASAATTVTVTLPLVLSGPGVATARATTAVSSTNTALPCCDSPEASRAMLISLNKVRELNGCSAAQALQADPRLARAATDHVHDLAANGVISHAGPDGTNLEDRLRRVGFPFQQRSEIIGVGTIQSVIDGWMGEPATGPHHASIVNCAYTDVGVGYAEDGRGASFWVVEFANRKQ